MEEVILLSILIALIAAVGVCIGVLKHYKTGLYAPIYPLDRYTNLKLTEKADIFLHRHVTRVKVTSDDKKK